MKYILILVSFFSITISSALAVIQDVSDKPAYAYYAEQITKAEQQILALKQQIDQISKMGNEIQEYRKMMMEKYEQVVNLGQSVTGLLQSAVDLPNRVMENMEFNLSQVGCAVGDLEKLSSINKIDKIFSVSGRVAKQNANGTYDITYVVEDNGSTSRYGKPRLKVDVKYL